MEPQSNPQSPIQPTLHPTYHPKIKPLIRRYCRENHLTEENSKKALKSYSKTFKAVKTVTDKNRRSSHEYIKGYMNTLAAQDSLSRLYYSFNIFALFENQYFFSKLRGLSRSLSSLEVQFFTNMIAEIPLKVLFKSLASLKNLACFKMELNNYSFNDPGILLTLLHNLQGLKSMESLSLSFLSSSKLNDAMKSFPRSLKNLTQLRSLELIFDTSSELTDQDKLSLISVFSKLPLLTKGSLNFGLMTQISGPLLLEIFQNFNSLSNITLELGLFQKTNENDISPVAEGLGYLQAPLVRQLRLTFRPELDSQTLIRLSQALENFTSLDLLQLNLQGFRALSNQSMAALTTTLRTLTSLNSLSLTFPRGTAESIVEDLATTITSLRNLNKLSLSFSSEMKTNSQQINFLFSNIGRLISLKYLHIYFPFQQAICDDALSSLGKSLQELVLLRSLSLNFHRVSLITNTGVEILTNAIKDLSHLTFLGLNFGFNNEINEIAIGAIAQALRCLPVLDSVHFVFAECPKLKEKGDRLMSLLTALQEMKNIHQVSLQLSRTQVIEREVNNLKGRKILTVFWAGENIFYIN